jgi:hypothetical protein
VFESVRATVPVPDPVASPVNVTAPRSIIDSTPLTLFLRKSLPSVVLTASSPRANCAVVGTLPVTAERLIKIC